MANRLKTTLSVFGLILQTIGYFHFLLLILIWTEPFANTKDDVFERFAITAACVFSGIFFMFLGNLIQKIWNIEFYLSHLANNSHQQIPDYKPLSEQRKPQQDKPSNPESDMSKYAPK
jgi:hypothetical protein